ncbi:MAG TPA: type I restriction enzyme HsdR N-terminal domain-containing protein [Caldilineaceae bacterium]|nr:type I restriction enzyme HsdR N-terminal domain-containing protein [Caldilineaceae bacterium]
MTAISPLQFALFTIVLVLAFGVILLLLRNAQREKETQMAENDAHRLAALEDQYEARLAQRDQELSQQIDGLEKELADRLAELHQVQETNKQLSAHVAADEQSRDQRCRAAWCKAVQSLQLTREDEVETKVVYPLLRSLGYQDSQILLKQPVPIGLLQNPVVIFVNFLVYQDGSHGQPVLLVYVSTPGKEIDHHLLQQVRAYGFAVNCSTYMVTNGRDFCIRQLRVPEDLVLHQGDLALLLDNWQRVRQGLGLGPTPDIGAQA